MYSLERKGELGTLILRPSHMLSVSVIIKEMYTTEHGTDVHENNEEGAKKVIICPEKPPSCEGEPKEFSAAEEQLDKKKPKNSAANVIQGGQSLSKNFKLAVELGIVVNVVMVLEA